MSPQLSLYLDLARFAAALVVFLSHFALHRLSGGRLWQLNGLGAEAVTFFFVLSGFVIAHATHTRETRARDYALARLSRIYSVALPAVALTLVLDALGRQISPGSYSSAWGYVDGFTLHRVLVALSFTNEVWAEYVRLGSNAAYWSLGYEVPFYVIAGLALYVPARWRVAAVGLALLFYGPAIALGLPLWLGGWWCYHRLRQRPLGPGPGGALFLLSLLAYAAYEMAARHWGRPLLPDSTIFKRNELLQDYILLPIFMANLIGFSAAAPRLGRLLMPLASPIRWLAGATFTLYLCHLPIAQFLVACSPWPVEDARSAALVLIGTLVLVFLLAAVTERRKLAWRHAFEAWLPKQKPA